MALNKDMKLWDMKRFLHEELKEQILLEIAPILHVGIPQGGYFGVTRQILCLVEFLGTLYCGYDKKRDGKDIAQTWKAEKFIKEVMGKDFDKNYEANGELMYTMYRHGLVHLYQPKTLKLKDGTELRWMAYKGGRDEHEEEIAGLKFTKSMEKEAQTKATRAIGIARQKVERNGITFKWKTAGGKPGDAILNVAKGIRADIIVIGARGLGAAKEKFFGSTSNYVMHKAIKPVLVVK